jgi:hypothetical protein
MNRARYVFIAILIVTLFIILSAKLYSRLRPKDQGPSDQKEKESLKKIDLPFRKKVSLFIASSSTKQSWMERVVANFHAEGKKTSSGAKIKVKVEPVLSGGSMNAILDGKLKPVVWSPGAESWVLQFIEKWSHTNNKSLMSDKWQHYLYPSWFRYVAAYGRSARLA